MRTFMMLLLVGVMAFSCFGVTSAFAAEDGTTGYTYGQYDMSYLPGTTDTVTNMPANETGLTPGANSPYTVSSTVPVREGFEFIDWTLTWGTMEKPPVLTDYVVKYLDKDTNEPVADEKTESGLEVGTSVTETAIPVGGYRLSETDDQGEPQSEEISLVLAESGNEIIFWYEEDIPETVDYSNALTVSKTAAGAELIDRSFTITLESTVNISADNAAGLFVEDLTVTDTIEDEFVLNSVTAEILDSAGSIVSSQSVSAAGPTVTYNFGDVQHGYTARLKLEVTAQPDFIGSNGVYTNVGLSGWTYKHTDPDATAADEYSVTCADTPQVNVRVIPITVNVGNATQRMGLMLIIDCDFLDPAGDPIPTSKYDQTRGTWSIPTAKIIAPEGAPNAGETIATPTMQEVVGGQSKFNWRVPTNTPLGDYPVPVEITFTAEGGPENSSTSYGQGTITIIPRQSEIEIIE